MKEAVDFLVSLAKAVSTMGLYETGHPSRERALDQVTEAAGLLQGVEDRPRFTFLGGEVVLDDHPLRELRHWDWGNRLAAVGVQRLELVAPVEREDLEVFLDTVFARLHGGEAGSAETRQMRPTSIRFGLVGLPGRQESDGSPELRTATLRYDLHEEFEAVGWLHEELRRGRHLHLLEAEAVVRSLTVAMHGDQEFLIPLLRLKEYDQYTTTHALNVAVLAMALAEFIGLSPAEVRAFGIAGLLHDVGKVEIPREILVKPGKLTEEERRVMNRHPVEGARLILANEERLDLAAVVAYEHHIRIDGGGYPPLRYSRKCHQASDLVHVCDVFDALSTDRPYRDAMERNRILAILEQGVGTEFDSTLARAFVSMIRKWEDRVAEVTAPSETLPEQDGQSTEGSRAP